MRLIAIASLVLCCSGCTLGWGSAFVGEWRGRKEIDYRACLEDEQGRCLKKREKTKFIPERSFFGVAHSLPGAMGASWVTHKGVTQPKFRMESTLEVLKGRGPLAFGVRLGAALDMDDKIAVMIPVTLHGHYALTDQFNIYGGGGWVPYAQHDGERSFVGARGLVGFRWSFANTFRQTFWLLGVEANTTWVHFDKPYLSTGSIGYVGAFF
jgi:hypothetical protein